MNVIEDKKIMIQQEGKSYDFTPYQDPEEIKGYLGFIDATGNFYKVREITDPEYEYPHNTWARYFMEYHNLPPQEDSTSSMALVKNYGFLLSSYQYDSYFAEGRTYITADHLGVCNESSCDTIIKNKQQLDIIKKIKEIENPAKVKQKK